METTTRRPQFSGPSTISPGNPATGPSSSLHTDEVESGVLRGPGEPTERVSAEQRIAATTGLLHAGAEAPAAAAEAQAASQRWLEASREGVRARPLTWLGIALAAGALIARMVR